MHNLLRTIGGCLLCLALAAACDGARTTDGDLGTYSKKEIKSAQSKADAGASDDTGSRPERSEQEAERSERDDAGAAAASDAGAAENGGHAASSDAGAVDASSQATDAGATAPASSSDTGPTQRTATSSWTMQAYEIGGSYNNSAETILSHATAPTLRMKFIVDVGKAVYGAPLLVEGKLIYTAGRSIYCHDLEHGTLLWEAMTLTTSSPEDDNPRAMTNTTAYENGVLYIQFANADVAAMNVADGKALWTQRRSPSEPFDEGYNSPIVVGDNVIVGRGSSARSSQLGATDFRGSLIAFNKHDGREVWRTYTVEENANGAGIWATAAADLGLGRVYAVSGNNLTAPASDGANSVLSIDVVSGELRFTYQFVDNPPSARGNGETGFEFGVSPIVFETEIDGEPKKLLAVGTRAGAVHVMNAETGQFVWSRSFGTGTADGDRGILANGAWSGKYLLYAMNEDQGAREAAQLEAFEPATGELVWSRTLAADVLGRITVANGIGFVGVGSQLEVFNVDDGLLIQSIDTGGSTAAGTASIANGHVAFGTGASWLAHDDAESGKVIVLSVDQP